MNSPSKIESQETSKQFTSDFIHAVREDVQRNMPFGVIKEKYELTDKQFYFLIKNMGALSADREAITQVYLPITLDGSIGNSQTIVKQVRKLNGEWRHREIHNFSAPTDVELAQILSENPGSTVAEMTRMVRNTIDKVDLSDSVIPRFLSVSEQNEVWERLSTKQVPSLNTRGKIKDVMHWGILVELLDLGNSEKFIHLSKFPDEQALNLVENLNKGAEIGLTLSLNVEKGQIEASPIIVEKN